MSKEGRVKVFDTEKPQIGDFVFNREVATVFDDGPDIPFLVTATGTYNMSIMVPQLAQISKIVVTNDTFQTLTLSCDIEYVEVT